MKRYIRWLYWIVSPTYKLAERSKKRTLRKANGAELLTKAIRRYNHYYVFATLLLAAVYGILLGANRHDMACLALARTLSSGLIGYVIVSRAIEIFSSFLIDATEKLNGVPSKSCLKFGDRLHLALNSYLELMLGFGLLYYLLPDDFFVDSFGNIIEAIYFSAVTMTTVGYGDFHPHHWISEILVVLQIFCSLTLALVCFTVYTTLALASKPENKKGVRSCIQRHKYPRKLKRTARRFH